MSTPAPVISGVGFLQHRAGDLIKGRYEVLDHLGGGNFGSVYRVRDAAVGNMLACKEMHVLNDPATSRDERAAALDLFKREALNLATLRHPNIPAAYFEQEDGEWRVCPRCGLDFADGAFCPVHGASLLPLQGRHYLMMDFIDGATLEEMALAQGKSRGRPLPEDQCIEWVAQIGSALRALHVVGIVHRDIKPDNIKIRASDNTAILLDFGLTKKVEEAGGYGTARVSGTGRFGTPGYAPENPEEREHPERRSDIYALGMTLYRLVCNRDPQEEDQLRDMMSHPARYFNRSLSPEVERIIGLATAPDRARRYQSIDDFLADLGELRAGTGSNAYAPPFTFSDGTRARSVSDLARLIETHPQESLPYLFNGMFGAWLLQNGFAAPARLAEAVVKEHAAQPARALELFRRALHPPDAPDVLPQLEVEPPALSFGAVDSGQQVTRQLRVRNVGSGLAWGHIATEEPSDADRFDIVLPGLAFPLEFEGNDVTLDITLDTRQVGNGAYSGALLLTVDGVPQHAATAQSHVGQSGAQSQIAQFATQNGAAPSAVFGAATGADMNAGASGAVVRVAVDYTVRPLQLRVKPDALDFGTVLVGKRALRRFKVECAGETPQGQPRGTIYAGASLGGLVAPERFAGTEPIEIVVDGGMADAFARSYEGALQLDTNGGRLRVPVRYALSLPPGRWLALVGGAMLTGGLAGALLRLLYVAVNPAFALRWLNSAGSVASPPVEGFRGPVLLGALIGLCYGMWWTARTWGKRGAGRVTFQALAQSLGLSAVLGATLCWPLMWALHWGVWAFGDWLLRPLAPPLPGDWGRAAQDAAPLMWALCGAVCGAAWGASRAFAALGKLWVRYAVYAFFLIAFLAMLINAMLA